MPGYDENDVLAAIRGDLPLSSLNSSKVDPTLLFCIIRGIRHHPDFANALRREPWVLQYPALLRAINARDIMSNVVPNMETDEEVPYCIWYPAIASEATYRALAERYPHMRYQVGRACAAAGYANLWRDLALLPDISIAEEARDNQANPESRLILETIMKEPVKWLVMNDYTRTVSAQAPLPARFGLNGDTAVRSTLDIKRSLGELGGFSTFGDRGYLALSGGSPFASSLSFNITEDWNIDVEDGACKPADESGTDAEMATLLWNPLPDHLPEGNKDVLILMAAYHGDIDRYARLRRPTRPLPQETACIQRGIYHNTMFARWWAEQPNNEEFQAAINARCIMNNDPSRITADTPAFALPSVIWYPSWACAETYREVVRLCPGMKPAAARAAIVADYQDLWDELLGSIDPSHALLAEASVSPNPHYAACLQRKGGERGMDMVLPPAGPRLRDFQARHHTINMLTEAASTTLLPCVGPDMVSARDGLPECISADAGLVNLFACAPTELRPPGGYSGADVEILYHERSLDSACSTEKSQAYTRSSRGGGRGRGTRGNDRGGRGSRH